MVRSSARSLSASRRRNRIISVSERFSWNTGCDRKPLPRGLPGKRARLGSRRHASRRTARQSPARSASVDVSSKLMPTWSASMTRSSRPSFSAAAAIALALPFTSTVTVSKRLLPSTVTPAASSASGQARRQPVHALGDRLQALRTVPDRIGGRHVGEQRLRGADVGGRLVAADVLLARLQGQPVAGAALACRPTGRRGGRASAGSACRRPRNRPHAGRQSRSARQSAASSRRRCRRRAWPARR